MKALIPLALVAATLGTVASADTLIVTRAAPMTYTTLHTVPGYVPQPIPTGPIRCVRTPCVQPMPIPLPTPWCLSCPPMPYDYDDRIIVLPRVILR